MHETRAHRAAIGAASHPGYAVSGPPDSGPQMRRLLADSQWSHGMHPFAHIRVANVFVPPVYEQLAAAGRGVLATGRDKAGSARLGYYGAKFDGHIFPFRHGLSGPLSIFASRAWVELLARATSVDATADVNGALHHHAKGSKSGFVHKDYSACWFIDRPRPDGVHLSDNALCEYRTGKTTVPGAVAHERIRAVAMIYYLNNPPWAEGDGGETGLYLRADDDVEHPAATVPPITNSMLVFECSPASYHSFISNRRHPRNSVAMWLHRTRESAVARWGRDGILYVRD
jgi:hypothetical protein